MDTFEPEEEIDVAALQVEINRLEGELADVRGRMAGYLKELGVHVERVTAAPRLVVEKITRAVFRRLRDQKRIRVTKHTFNEPYWKVFPDPL